MFNIVPFRRDDDFFSVFDDMEKRLMQNFSGQLPSFNTDIVDKGDNFVLEADMPGVNKEDINIDIDGNRLTITAKHDINKEENKDDYIRRERRYGSFRRSFDVSNVKTEEIKANYKNGVLILELPKKNKEYGSKRKINID